MTEFCKFNKIVIGDDAEAKTPSELPWQKSGSSILSRKAKLRVAFERNELDALFFLYGRMVKAGEWRDYALDHLEGTAVFSVFRRSQERPVYYFEKLSQSQQRKGAYALLDAGGRMLRRSSSLLLLIRLLEERVARSSPHRKN